MIQHIWLFVKDNRCTLCCIAVIIQLLIIAVLLSGYFVLGYLYYYRFSDLSQAPPDARVIAPEAEAEHDPSVPPTPIETPADLLRAYWDSKTPVRSWAASELLAELSDRSYYSNVKEDEAYFRAQGFLEVDRVTSGSMIGYVLSVDDVSVIVFRGTDMYELADWFVNLTARSMDTEHGPVHEGFYAAYQSMKPHIDNILQGRETKHLWVTGHSLGGALAVLCAYDLEQQNPNCVSGVITFGQPLVAKPKLATYLDKLFEGRYARFVNREDIVPRVPSHHVPFGSLVWFTDEGVKRSANTELVFSSLPPGVEPEEAPDAPEEPEQVEVIPVTDEEFEKLKKEALASQQPQYTEDGQQIYMGNIPRFLNPHMISNYIDELKGYFRSPPAPTW